MASHQIFSSRREGIRFSVSGPDLPEVQGFDDQAKPDATCCPTLDLRKVYAASSKNRCKSGSSRSLSSRTTQWSTTTTPVSNTSERREDDKRRKKRFLQFTRVLMKLLQRKDPAVYRGAQSVIHECEQQKKRGQAESVTEILKGPLKDIVGSHYWNEARHVYEKKLVVHCENHLDIEPLSATEEPPPLGEEHLSILQDSLRDSVAPMEQSKLVCTAHPTLNVDEQQTRKKRLWMIICILMKYLDRSDKVLYHTAKVIVHDCVRRNRNKENGYRSLSGSIQSSLKNEIGPEYWRRAEKQLANVLIGHSEGGTTQSVPSYDATKKKRTLGGSRVHFDSKRPRRFFEI